MSDATMDTAQSLVLARLEAKIDAIVAKLDWDMPRVRVEAQETSSAIITVNQRLAAIEDRLSKISFDVVAENLDNSNMTDPGQLDAETVSDPPEAPPASTESASLPAVPEPEIDGEIENLMKWLYLKDADPIPIRNAIVKLFSLYPHYPQARLELFMSSSHCQKWYCMRDILQHDELYDAREVEDGARRAGGSGCALCKPEASCLQIKPAGAKLAHVDRYNEMYCARLVATRR